jgi:hypothetical protein
LEQLEESAATPPQDQTPSNMVPHQLPDDLDELNVDEFCRRTYVVRSNGEKIPLDQVAEYEVLQRFLEKKLNVQYM